MKLPVTFFTEVEKIHPEFHGFQLLPISKPILGKKSQVGGSKILLFKVYWIHSSKREHNVCINTNTEIKRVA